MLHSWKQSQLDELKIHTSAGAPSPKAMAEELAKLHKELAKSRRMYKILKNGVLLKQGRLNAI
jgi:hypothetical protein